MKKIILLAIMLIALLASTARMAGQSQKHPWWVVDGGGGKSTASGLLLQASVGQHSVQRMLHTGTGLDLESGYIPGIRLLGGSATSYAVVVDTGWNMVSVPLIVPDFTKDSVFPAAISPAYMFNNGYLRRDTLENGLGYWLKYAVRDTVPMMGTSIVHDTIAVIAGWNMIGNLSYPVPITDVSGIPPVVITPNYYGYVRPAGYFSEDTLLPGKGYWVKVNQSGQIVMHSGSVLAAPSLPPASKEKPVLARNALADLAAEQTLNSLTVRDADGRSQTLYFTARTPDVNADLFELPPPPPAGELDVRFASQKMLEMYEPAGARERLPLVMSGARYPLLFEWDIAASDVAVSLECVMGTEALQAYSLSRTGSVTLESLPIQVALRIEGAEAPALPQEFALHQNYPNPFNPSTTIRYDLPAASRVSLKIYNVLGQEVVTLVDEVQEAGYKSLRWSADGISSGTYFYRITAGSHSDVKKLLIIK